MNRSRAWMVAVVVLGLGCTEPNPNAIHGESTGGSSGGTTPGSESMTTMPDPTLTEGPTTASTTVDTTATETGVDTTMGTADPTGDPTGDASSTGEPVCAAGTHVCVGEAPVGWTGPVALLPSDGAATEPTCEGDWPELSATAFTDLQASAANCDCECAASNAECTAVTLLRDNNNNCLSPTESYDLGLSCFDIEPDISASQYFLATAAVSDADCTPMPTEEVAPAAFSARTTLCGAPAGTALGCAASEQCLPVPDGAYDGRICIWQSGDLECPDGALTERTLLHQDIADDRGCSACTCGTPEGSCSGAVFLFNAESCGGSLLGNIPVGGACTLPASNLTVYSADVNGALTPEDVTCPPSNSSPIGDAEAIDPITVCCLP